MSTNKIEASIQFVANLVEDRKIDFEKSHPWRNDGLHVLQHGLRVGHIAQEIIKKDQLEISEQDKESLQLVAILHDIGSIQGRENHGLKSVDLCTAFLSTIVEADQQKNIESIIAEHSSKSNRNTSLLSNIFKDADLIDEYGVQSLLMCANWVDRSTAFFFRELEARIGDKELTYADQLLTLVHTPGAKEIIHEKKEFMNQLHEQLKYENSGSLDYETYLVYRD